MKQGKLNRKIEFRVSEEDYEIISAAAQKNHQKISELARASTLFCAKNNIWVCDTIQAAAYVALIDAIEQIEDDKVRTLVRSRLEDCLCLL